MSTYPTGTIVYVLELKAMRPDGKWGEWYILPAHTYWDRETARWNRKRLHQPKAGLYSARCRIVTFRRDRA